MRTNNATFANFICRFGDGAVLLDYAIEIVIPAFTRDTYVRSYGDTTHYHFYEVEIVILDADSDPPVVGLAGRFIKNTELTRYQIFDQRKGLVQDEQRMPSATSVFFVLILNNHRLIYFPETPHAPDLNVFRTTAQQFMRQRHKEFINELYEELHPGDGSITKKVLNETHPRPSLEIIPLTTAEDIAAFIHRYEILKRIDFRLVRPNDDIDAGEIFEQIRELSAGLNANKTKVTTANPKDGLDIETSIETVTEATERGNQDITLSGTDHDGHKLSGNNEHFQIYAPIDKVPKAKPSLVAKLYEAFTALVESGAIRLPDQGPDQIARVKRMIDLL